MSVSSASRAVLLAAAALAPLGMAQAQSAACNPAGARPLALGSLAEVPAGPARSFAITLERGQGVVVDLEAVSDAPPAASGDEHDHGGSRPAERPRALALCDASGKLLAPSPGEVFAKGGSVTVSDGGERLRFTATASGTYLVGVAAGEAPREVLVRRRAAGTAQAPVISARLGQDQRGIVSSKAPMVFSFAASAGQWVELKSTSERDTVLRLAGPDREGAYSVIAENDDSDGLNPMLRRKLGVAGTYYVQVDSLSDEPGEFDLTLKAIAAPAPPPPPAALRPGVQVSGRLADDKAVAVYALPVVAGKSYRVEVTASYDAALAIGVANPLEPDNGGDGPDAGFTEIKSQDAGTTGTERLTFTARGNGTVLVRVRNFGIGETDGSF
ncbi:MAG TPA: hypothetical protein PKE25_08625, partial [Novosphingobium sp.]|nr:hypothetical protein [Novosphingobium sp.]